jgi:nitroreductase
MSTSVQDSSERLISFLRSLRQTRNFSDQTISDDDLHEILEVARWTGSARNAQPWEFIVVRKRELLRALAEAYPYAAHVGQAAVVIVLVLSRDRAFDEGRLAERILLAAKARGLGAGIGGFGIDGGEKAKAILGIPEDRFARTAVAIGHAAEGPKESGTGGRKPLDELVHEDRY